MALLPQEVLNDMQTMSPSDYTPIPEGEYTLFVAKTESKSTKNGRGQYIKVEFNVLGPSYQGRKLFANFNIINDSLKAMEIGRRQLKSLADAAGVDPLTDTDQLVGATVIGVVRVREASGDYDESNEIRRFKPVTAAAGQSAPSVPASGGSFAGAFTPQAQAPQGAPFAW